VLRPAKAPGFSYAWLELISHRVFIGRMLALTPQQKVRVYIHIRYHLSAENKFTFLYQDFIIVLARF
jgi:hypothetical protein